jgi:hypothetical protein
MIYQSLHQSFLQNFKLWYFFIARKNTIDENCYFTNVVWLYEKWSKRNKRQGKIYKFFVKKFPFGRTRV